MKSCMVIVCTGPIIIGCIILLVRNNVSIGSQMLQCGAWVGGMRGRESNSEAYLEWDCQILMVC